MTKQEAIAEARAALVELEMIMDANPAPFEDAAHNARYSHQRKVLARFHADMEELLRDDDPSVQFGGGK